MGFKIVQTLGRGLCATCREAQVIETDNHEIVTLCHAWGGEPPRIERTVVRCTDYDVRGAMNKHELEKIAWVVRTDKTGKSIGFTPPVKKNDDY